MRLIIEARLLISVTMQYFSIIHRLYFIEPRLRMSGKINIVVNSYFSVLIIILTGIHRV